MESKKESLGSLASSVNAAGDPAAEWSRLESLAIALGEGARAAAAHVAARLAGEFGFGHVLVFGREKDREDFAILGSAGLDEADGRADVLAFARRLAGWVETSKVPLSVANPAADPRFVDLTDRTGPVHAVPLLSAGAIDGALVVFDSGTDQDPAMSGTGTVTDSTRAGRLLAALGASARFAALAVRLDRARGGVALLTATIEESEKARLRAERLAFAGETAARTAREMQAPLASLGGIAARLADETEESDPRHPLLDIMAQEVARLDRLLTDQIDLAELREPELRPDDLNRLLAECLMLVDADMQRRKLRVTRRLAPGLPSLLLDSALLRRFFLNLLRAAMERAPEGGRVKVETRRRGDVVEALVAADGVRDPGHTLDELWVPFHPENSDRGGPSYDAAERILREHHRALRVISNSDWPLVFALTLPIPGNQDRRRQLRDRRAGRDRRRG
jgi:signal transduction histidine kinase